MSDYDPVALALDDTLGTNEVPIASKITRETSSFKFSQITRHGFGVGAALFILENMGKLQRKDKQIIVDLVGEICAAYLIDRGLLPPTPDYSPPPTEPPA